MSGVVKSIFGGTDNSQQQQQVAANAQARGDIAARAGQARSDALNLVPLGDINRNLGFQSALDVLGQAAPQQLSTFQQGNINAQNALLGGFPQFQNAILGGQVDMSALQPQQVTFDPSFLQQQLPDFAGSTVTGGGLNTPQKAALSQLLGGAANFNQANQLPTSGNGPASLSGSPVVDRSAANQFGLTSGEVDTSLMVAGLLGIPAVGIGRDFSNLGTLGAARKHANLKPPSFIESLLSSESFRDQAERAVKEAKQADIEREKFARQAKINQKQAQERAARASRSATAAQMGRDVNRGSGLGGQNEGASAGTFGGRDRAGHGGFGPSF